MKKGLEKEVNEYYPKNAMIFGSDTISRGLLGFELYHLGYTITFVDKNEDFISHLKEEKSYNVILNGNKHKVQVKEAYNLDSDFEMEKTGLILVRCGKKDINKVGKKLASLIIEDYAVINNRDRHFLNIIECDDNIYRPASKIRKAIHITWAEEDIRKAYALAVVGISGFRITNAIVQRECHEEENYDVSVKPKFDWMIEDKIYYRYKSNVDTTSYDDLINIYEELTTSYDDLINSYEELEKIKKRKKYIHYHDQFKWKEIPGVKLISNIEYEKELGFLRTII